MRYFYFKDENQNFAIRGMAPHNDEDCRPFDHFRFGHAELASAQLQEILKLKCPFPIPDDMVRKFVLEQTDEMISEQLSKTKANPAISKLIKDDSLSKDAHLVTDRIELNTDYTTDDKVGLGDKPITEEINLTLFFNFKQLTVATQKMKCESCMMEKVKDEDCLTVR